MWVPRVACITRTWERLDSNGLYRWGKEDRRIRWVGIPWFSKSLKFHNKCFKLKIMLEENALDLLYHTYKIGGRYVDKEMGVDNVLWYLVIILPW